MKTLNGVSFQSSQGWGRQTMHDNFSWADMGPTRNKSKTAWRQSGLQQSEAVWTEQKAWPLHRGYGQEVPAEEPRMNPGDHHEKRSELEGSARPGGRTSLNVPSQQAMGKQQQEGQSWTRPLYCLWLAKVACSPNYQFWLVIYIGKFLFFFH